MKFVKKNEAVDAVRFALSGKEKLDYFEGYPVFFDPDKETGVAYLRLATPNGSKRVDVGDWIVRSDKGIVNVYTSEAFRLLYESVNENFEKNSEGFISAYKRAMAKLKESGKKLLSADALAGMVEYKNGDQFELFVKVQRVVVEKEPVKKEESEKENKEPEKSGEEPKEDIKKDGGA